MESKSLVTSTLTQQCESIKLNIKKQIIEIAKEWPLYFSRLFPVAVRKNKKNKLEVKIKTLILS